MKNLKEIIKNLNLTKRSKIIIIIGVIILIAGSLITFRIISNNNLKKNILVYQEKVYELYTLSSFSAANIHNALNDYIFDDKEYFIEDYGRMTSRRRDIYVVRCNDISDVTTKVVEYHNKKGIYNKLEKLHKEVKELNKEIKSSCSKNSPIYELANELYKITKKLYDCAKSPAGNYQQYSQSINNAIGNFDIQFSELEIEIGDFSKSKREKIEKKIISYFIENKNSNNTIEESGLITETVTETIADSSIK